MSDIYHCRVWLFPSREPFGLVSIGNSWVVSYSFFLGHQSRCPTRCCAIGRATTFQACGAGKTTFWSRTTFVPLCICEWSQLGFWCYHCHSDKNRTKLHFLREYTISWRPIWRYWKNMSKKRFPHLWIMIISKLILRILGQWKPWTTHQPTHLWYCSHCWL